jgi:hypothetical protein
MTPRLARAVLAVVLVSSVPAGAERVALRTVEGRVVALETVAGEGAVEVLAAKLVLAERSAATTVLLAPEDLCREIGFEIEEGDVLRVRVFVGEEDEPVKAQKAMNVSRGLMVRLRTMRAVPLWSDAGAWQGGPSRGAPGSGRGHGPGAGPGAGPGQGPRPGGGSPAGAGPGRL